MAACAFPLAIVSMGVAALLLFLNIINIPYGQQRAALVTVRVERKHGVLKWRRFSWRSNR